MNLRKRLIISNAAVVIIPFIIMTAASFVYIYVSSRIFNTEISYGSLRSFVVSSSVQLGSEGKVLADNPDMLREKEFQQYIEARLKSINANIVVTEKNNILFSTLEVDKIDVEKCLNAAEKGLLSNSVDLDNTTYSVKVLNTRYKDGEYGSIILLASAAKEAAAARNFLIFGLMVFFLSFLIVNVAISLVFSNSVLSPLSRLGKAAGEISRGNLDYEITEGGDKEIKELCSAFEQMRVQLKESVHMRLKYDDNRKMLVSSISHDLKTPVTSIKGYVEGIMDGVANSPEKVDKYLKTIYSKTGQIDAMIDDLLLYSKLDLNQIPFNFEMTDMVPYLKDCIYEVEPEMEKAGIKVSFKNETEDSCHTALDRERMRRALVNILDNAKKYMDKEEKQIDIILRETRTNLIIEIKDNGRGIAREDIPYIFDRFYRGDAARGKMGGSGLGLAITRQIVEGHGGRIWARSKENESTSIIISLKKTVPEGAAG